MSCPAPFLDPKGYPATGGYIGGRLCGSLSADLKCCLPCDKQNWIYSNHFNSTLRAAYWLNVPSLVCQVFLLLTFLVVPKKLSHRHYLNISLCIAFVILELSFIVPLAANPDVCLNDITPRNQHSSMSCAWSGALFISGSAAATLWILLRSIWIHLRLCWPNARVDRLSWAFQMLGWGIPAILVAVAMSVTGVSYRLGTTCLPNQHRAFQTYLGWLMAFSSISAILQIITTAYCLWIYLRDAIRGPKSTLRSQTGYTGGVAARRPSDTPSVARAQKATWRRMRGVWKNQWRSILMCIINIVNDVYYGSVFARQTAKNKAIFSGRDSGNILQWATCIVINGGDKNKCQHIANVIDQPAFLTSFVLAGIVGMVTFLLMVRTSMFKGWIGVIRHGRTSFNENDDDDDGMGNHALKRKSFGRKLESEKTPYTNLASPTSTTPPTPREAPYSPVSPITPPLPLGVLHDAGDSRQPSVQHRGVPVAGDATQRHETTTMFDDESEDEVQPRRRNKADEIMGGTAV